MPAFRSAFVAVLLALPAFAADPYPPNPATVTGIAIHPAKVTLRSADDTAQLVVTATLTDGRTQDVTHAAQFAAADGKTFAITTTGRVSPKANGATELVATFSGKTAKVPATSDRFGENLPLNFPNQVEPILTKLGCNSGGCHGKQSGQNGFRLSLLGFDPESDYAYLVKESRGRRLMPSSPDASLLLTKAAGIVPHGGGKKTDTTTDEYKQLRRWIAAGMPYGTAADPTVTTISVFPETRVMTRRNQQQIAVYAHYSDGTVEDITRRAQFETNDPEIATVDGNGLVKTQIHSGQAAIMARYQGQVAVFRSTVPLGVPTPAWQFPEQTVVDKHTSAKWKELGLVPSDVCTDEQFIRRVSLDITGTLPTPKQVTDFVADKASDKRSKLVDKLLESPEYAFYFANKWADVLRVKRRNEPGRAAGTFAFHAWIREAVAADMPYSEFTRQVLGATGDETKNPPVVWYKELEKPEQFVDDLSQVFLGQRLGCAQCHHHPYEKWSQDDYWGLAGYFARLGRKRVPQAGKDPNGGMQVIFTSTSGTVMNKRTGKPAIAKPLDGPAAEFTAEDDPRQKLVDWMTAPKNPFFAKAVANRYWAHFFGRGIVDPMDDMRVTNPPSNPALLDALAADLVANKYSLKALVKTIVKSRTYQLSAVPNEFNQHDKQAYARYYPKRLQAEVLLDAVNQFADSPQGFNGLPKDRYAPQRAIQLPDESFSSYFLDVFGRPQRISACECERVSDANLAQALHLLNSDEIQGKVGRQGGRADQLANPKDTRSDTEKIEEIFLWAFARKPTSDDLKAALDHLAKHDKAKRTGYENIIWALMNTKEFVFNQ